MAAIAAREDFMSLTKGRREETLALCAPVFRATQQFPEEGKL
jgi:hypothetical protein